MTVSSSPPLVERTRRSTMVEWKAARASVRNEKHCTVTVLPRGLSCEKEEALYGDGTA